MSVRDDRREPFIWATVSSLALIEAEWSPDDGVSLGHVRSVYVAFIQLAFAEKVRGGMEAIESGQFRTPRADICRKAGISDKPVDNAVAVLERIGLLRVERSGARPSVYTLVEAEAGAGVTPHPEKSPATEQVQSSSGETPEPATESLRTPPYKEKKGKKKETHSGGDRRKVSGKVVTDSEYALATEIIAVFNKAAGTGVTVDAHLTPVVGRIREKPELGAEEHRELIVAVFAVPWWTGAAGPAVIYGNPEIFERSIETWRSKPTPRHLAVASTGDHRRLDAADYEASRRRLRERRTAA